MRDFILSDITGGNKAPFSKRSLEHVNEMTSELNTMFFETLTDFSSFGTDFVIIRGCVISGSMPGAITWTAGLVYYSGDFYRVDAGGVTVNVGETAVWNYSDSYISGDPATYSDTNTYNFHRIRKMTLTSAVSGSGLKDYDDAVLYTKVSNSTSVLGTPSYIAPITNITKDNIYFLRKGNKVMIAGQLTITCTSTATLDFQIPIANATDYANVNYGNYYANLGSGTWGYVIGDKTSVASPNASGHIRFTGGATINILRFDITNDSALTSYEVFFSVEYYTEKPYSAY
jgi:hypothetical protein